MKVRKYYASQETIRANSMIRQSITDGIVARWKAYRDTKTGRVERIRAACAAGDESKARSILHDLMGLSGASDDTIRKGLRAFRNAYPTL